MNIDDSMPSMTPEQLGNWIRMCVLGRSPRMPGGSSPTILTGPPGMGKTQVFEALGRELVAEKLAHFSLTMNLTTKDRFSLTGVETMEGTFSVGFVEYFLRREAARIKLDWKDIMSTRPVVIVDEITGVAPECLLPVCEMIEQRRLGHFELPPYTVFLMTGNRVEDRSNAMPLPMNLINKSGMVSLRMTGEYLAELFTGKGYNWRLCALVNAVFGQLVQEMPEANVPWPTPRSFEHFCGAVDALVKFADTQADPRHYMNSQWDLIENSLRAYCGPMLRKVVKDQLINDINIPHYADIVRSPRTATIPLDPGDVIRVVMMMAASVKPADFASIDTYMQRISEDELPRFMKTLGKRTDSDASSIRTMPASARMRALYAQMRHDTGSMQTN